MRATPSLLIATAVAALAVLGGCSKEREAEAHSGGAEAEVSTTLPEGQVSDAQLKAAAEAAAQVAATPATSATESAAPK